MIERDNLVLSIRNSIPNIIEECNSEFESFQNKTLRPILKFQNELTMFMLKDSKGFGLIEKISNSDEFVKQLNLFVDKNLKLKNQIVATVTALFTTDEFTFYIQNKREVSKRILSMQSKRYKDELIS
jgi:hypothetical protein